MIKKENKIIFILFAIDVFITLFFSIFAIVREGDISYLFFALVYHIPTIIMTSSFSKFIPSKNETIGTIALVGNMIITAFFWCSTIQGNWLYLLLLFALFCNIIYCLIFVMISFLLKTSNKSKEQ